MSKATDALDAIRSLAVARNAVDADLDPLERGDRQTWKEQSPPLYERQRAIDAELGPLLLDWAEANGCGHYVSGFGAVGRVGWLPARAGYRRMREATGLTAKGGALRGILNRAAWELERQYWLDRPDLLEWVVEQWTKLRDELEEERLQLAAAEALELSAEALERARKGHAGEP